MGLRRLDGVLERDFAAADAEHGQAGRGWSDDPRAEPVARVAHGPDGRVDLREIESGGGAPACNFEDADDRPALRRASLDEGLLSVGTQRDESRVTCQHAHLTRAVEDDDVERLAFVLAISDQLRPRPRDDDVAGSLV
jgi:hypothetical protein